MVDIFIISIFTFWGQKIDLNVDKTAILLEEILTLPSNQYKVDQENDLIEKACMKAQDQKKCSFDLKNKLQNLKS